MSFILDALKRADRERRLERPPDLSAVYEEDKLPRPSIQPWLWLSGSFLVGAIVVGLILWPKGPGSDRPPLLTDTSAPRVSSLTAPAGKGGTPPSNASPTGRVLKPPEAPPVRSSQPQPAPAPVQEAPPARSAGMAAETAVRALPDTGSKPAAETPNTEAVPPEGDASDTPGPVVSAEKKGPGQPAPPVSSIPEAAPVEPATADLNRGTEKGVEATARSSEPPSAPPADKKTQMDGTKRVSIPLISELPPEVREKLGKLQINVHSYSEKPAECLVFINMRRFKVGDRIGKTGPILKEITPEGVIIDYGEGQTRLPVWR